MCNWGKKKAFFFIVVALVETENMFQYAFKETFD